MKRFILFWGEQHYPGGGMTDFEGDYDFFHDAVLHAELNEEKWEWMEVFDHETGQVWRKARMEINGKWEPVKS